ncbi:DUF2007 domain-containing protein [Autumnicola musiva]|uniref:DUF2007 domain-containing protein n=1 Tax=Autumnicola musiva TaxID=3075589 RepID=A0ABU3DA88_9FLAO|nr:DUF2007 domain-containing protein [Zunongwangia sp. F117]MDT0678443.1 DUF2007 domain-containing protein [Zunongwangia sp. F117]
MKLIDIFRSSYQFEISNIKNLFKAENIYYQVRGEAMDSAAGIGGMGNDGMRIAVEEGDYSRAREILENAGFAGENISETQNPDRKSQFNKWLIGIIAILITLALLSLFAG